MSADKYDLVITGGEVIDPRIGPLNGAAILARDGKIVAVETDKRKVAAAVKGSDREAIVDATGRIVAPGLIDIHVHLREPGREDEETVQSGARAAAAGGFTTICCMPNTSPAIDDQETVRFVLSEAQGADCRVCVVGSVTKRRAGEELAEIGDLVKAGVVAISDDGDFVQNPDLMRRALEYARMFDIPIMQHAEDKYLVGDGVMNESFASAKLGMKGRPAVAEEIAVLRDIKLASFTGGKIHIQHASSAGSVEAIRRAKAEGVRISAEACPHHFTLTDGLIGESFDTNLRVNPPIRTQADVDAIIAGLVDGTIDCIATDHAPHSAEEKDVEFDGAPAGMIGLETALGLVKTQLIDRGALSWTDAIRLLTVNPARIIDRPFGDLTPGHSADLVVIDPDKEWIVDPSTFKSRSRNTPFGGWKLSARVERTILAGRTTFLAGR
ncbi:MAG: dihydroorotase [Candidatus Zixiibacteriota bacterium]